MERAVTKIEEISDKDFRKLSMERALTKIEEPSDKDCRQLSMERALTKSVDNCQWRASDKD